MSALAKETQAGPQTGTVRTNAFDQRRAGALADGIEEGAALLAGDEPAKQPTE